MKNMKIKQYRPMLVTRCLLHFSFGLDQAKKAIIFGWFGSLLTSQNDAKKQKPQIEILCSSASFHNMKDSVSFKITQNFGPHYVALFQNCTTTSRFLHQQDSFFWTTVPHGYWSYVEACHTEKSDVPFDAAVISFMWVHFKSMCRNLCMNMLPTC